MNAVDAVRRMRPVAWGLSALALVAMVLLWSPWTSTDNRGAPAPGVQTGLQTKPGLDLYPPSKRVGAPKLEGTTLNGEPFSLSNLAGSIVVINVWGSWCAPCRAETPDLVRLANEDTDQGVRFVGINTRDNLDAAKAFVRSFKVPYPSVRDNNGEVLLAFRDTIPTTVVPTTLVVDAHGQIAARVIGPVTYNTLKGIINDEIALREANR
jgi:thiol-disulfide isomerase/thioredoxin